MQDILTETNDFITNGGDFLIGRSNEQHQEHLLVAQKGAYKENPDVGIGIEDFINESENEAMLNMIREEFEKDGMSVHAISYNELTGDLNFEADYE